MDCSSELYNSSKVFGFLFLLFGEPVKYSKSLRYVVKNAKID